jgi:hypothetical protein
MMLSHNRHHFMETGDGFEDTNSNRDMVAHELHFLGAELARLIENGRGCTNFADVVQQRSAVHDLQISGRQGHGMGDLQSQCRHSSGVARGPGRLCVDGAGQRGERPNIQLFERLHRPFQLFLLAASFAVLVDCGTKCCDDLLGGNGLGKKPENSPFVYGTLGGLEIAATA